MKKKLIQILESICSNVYLQGTINEDESFPDTFITFWTDYTIDDSFYDNNANAENWRFSIFIYSIDPMEIESKANAIRKALKQAKFIAYGKGNDIPSGIPSHTGWVMEYRYKEILKEQN